MLRISGGEETNTLSRARMLALTETVASLHAATRPLVITGNHRFFSAGADLKEIVALDGYHAYEFAKMGQSLMDLVSEHPAPTIAAVHGFCMGGGLDLALACTLRIAAPYAIFGHRGTSLGIITGWGGTQRLPEIIGKGRALQMFLCAEKVDAHHALEIGLIDEIAADPVKRALERLSSFKRDLPV